MEDSTVRQRKHPQPDQPEEQTPVKRAKIKKTRAKNEDEEDEYTPWVDVLRVITFLLLASCGLSYVISGGDSWWWGLKQKPSYMTVNYWKDLIKGPPPPIYLTLDELSAYDGTDPEKPVYLAINGTIYDVSNGRRIYGPGGPYNFFAGVDAARAYVTGCFKEDRTADMRGVENMFLPLDDPETDAHWSAEELAELRAKELEKAKDEVQKSLQHWVEFFAKSPKYSKVGYLVREEGWLEKETPRELCAPAQKGRKKRKIPTNE